MESSFARALLREVSLNTHSAYRDLVLNSIRRHFSYTQDEAAALYAYLGDGETAKVGTELNGDQGFTSPKFLLDGWAAEQRVLSDGRRQIYRFLVPGDIIQNSQPAWPDPLLVALTDVTYAIILMPSKENTLAGARFAEAMFGLMERSLRDQVVRLGCLSGPERIAHLLLELYFRLERVGLAKNGRFRMPVGQEGLADAAGLSIVHTNRVLHKLRDEGLLEIKRDLYNLPDLDKLIQRAKHSLASLLDECAVNERPDATPAPAVQSLAPP
jgi:CRP-like cAMP-binding protein